MYYLLPSVSSHPSLHLERSASARICCCPTLPALSALTVGSTYLSFSFTCLSLQKFGKDFDELEGRERQSVGGTVGGQHRKQQMEEVSLLICCMADADSLVSTRRKSISRCLALG